MFRIFNVSTEWQLRGGTLKSAMAQSVQRIGFQDQRKVLAVCQTDLKMCHEEKVQKLFLHKNAER